MTHTKHRWRRWLPTLIRLLISGAFLWGVFHFANLDELVQILAGVHWSYLAAGFAAFALGEFLTVVKWGYLLAKVRRPVRLALLGKAILVGNFYGMFLPTSVGGDVARVLMTGPAAGGMSMSAATVFMQRNTGMGALLLIANIASWLPPLRIEVFPRTLDIFNYLGIWFAAIGIGYVLVNWGLVSERIYRFLWRRLSQEHGGRAPTGLRRIAYELRKLHEALRLCRRAWGGALTLSLITQLLDCVMAYLVARGLGLQVPFLPFCVYVPAVTLAALLPVTFNGVGLRESVYLLLMNRSGIAAEQAVGVSLLHFAFMVVLAVAGGFWQALYPLEKTPDDSHGSATAQRGHD